MRVTILCCALALSCSGVIEPPAEGTPAAPAGGPRPGARPPGGAPGAPAPDGVPPATVPAGAPPVTAPPVTAPAGLAAIGGGAMARLSRREYAAAIQDLLKLARAPGRVDILPQDVLTPFDNDGTTQATSAVVIAAARDIAREAAALAFPAKGNPALLPCQPSGPADDACLAAFVKSFGRRALRRPLADSEVAELVRLGGFSRQEGDFHAGVRLVVETLLQDPEFVYHVEIGTPAAGGLVRLTPFELASRISFGLRGLPPDDALLDAAATGRLDDAEGVRAAVRRVLATPEAGALVARFHAMWLGYAELRVPEELAAPMQAEADALVKRVVMERERPWTDLLTADEAFVDARLAKLYGVPAPAAPAWVKLAQPERRGVLGQAAYLSAGAKFGDTSPVLRGIQVRERLLCQPILPPPPEVNADEPPEADAKACKSERYAKHAEAACAGCHRLIDPVGNGLENFDALGVYRKHELDRPDCPVTGEGELVETGRKFQGGAALGKLLAASEAVDACVATQLLRFLGRRQLSPGEQSAIGALTALYIDRERSLKSLIVELAATPAFRHRVAEVQP